MQTGTTGLSERALLYFTRLGLSVPSPGEIGSAALLGRLQYAHVTGIPYENIDILSRKGLPMTYAGQFDKIVLGRRGGYCFELNGLLAGLLDELGYSVTTYMGRYLRGETTIPMRRHRVIRVACSEGPYICDVGVGQQAPRYPLALIPDRVQEQCGEAYKLVREPFLGWVIYDRHGEEWRRFYSFTEEEQLEIDFVMPSYYCEHAPDSIFNKRLMLSIKTAEGRMTLDGRTFRTFSSAGVQEERVPDLVCLRALLRDAFRIDCPDLPQDVLDLG
jgi:N-hydroxyarylamine O-acetyltransferase